MTEVFLSYAREDEATARALAGALETAGLAVWWDIKSIVSGQIVREAIRAALDSAVAVVVVWSTHSIGSRWVCDEADVAVERGVLHPVRIEDVEPPMGLKGFGYIDLSHWDGNSEDPMVDRLVAELVALVPKRREGPAPGLWSTWDRSTARKGTRRAAASRVQRALRTVGFPVVVDGVFGRATRLSVRWFQTSKGLDGDGVVGPQTWDALLTECWYRWAAEPLLAVGSRGSRVAELQRELGRLGNTIQPDGSFGPATLRFVRALQHDHGLGADGIVGPDTYLALQHAEPTG